MKNIKAKVDTSVLQQDPTTLRAFERELENILAFNDAINRISDQLTQFETNLKNSHNQNEFIDLKLARELYVTCGALLRLCQKKAYEPHVPFSLAAISYFINPKDGHNDKTDIDGFEDDKRVVQMVIHQFNLAHQVEAEIKEMQKNGENQSA